MMHAERVELTGAPLEALAIAPPDSLAVDSDGNVSTASVDIVVQPAPVFEPARPAPSPLWCWAGLIVIGGGLAAGAYALGRRSRRVRKPKEA